MKFVDLSVGLGLKTPHSWPLFSSFSRIHGPSTFVTFAPRLCNGYNHAHAPGQHIPLYFFSLQFLQFSTPYHLFSTSCQLFSTPPFKFSLPALFYSEQSTFFTLPLHTPFWAVCSLNKFQVAPDQDCRSSNHEYSTSSEEQETQSAPQSGQVQKSCRILDHLIIWSCYKYTSKFVHQNVNSVLIGQFLEILLEAFICLGLS